MDARRELLKKQEEHDEYKSAQVQKIRAVKDSRFPRADILIDELKQTPKYTQLVKYIQYLEHINVGTWCDNCKGAKTVHSDDADEFVKQLAANSPQQIAANSPQQTLQIDQLRADVASLKTITHALNARVSAIESTITAMQKNSYKVDLVSADELFQ